MPPNPEPNELKNTIDVQLNLLKDSEIDSLKKIFDQFKASTDSLKSLGTVADRLEAAAGSSALSPTMAAVASHQATAPPSKLVPSSLEDQSTAIEKSQGRLDRLREHVHKGAYDQFYGKDRNTLTNLLMRGELRNWRYKDFAGLAGYGLGKGYFNSEGESRFAGGRGVLLGGAAGLAGAEAAGVGPTQLIASIAGTLRAQGPATFGSNLGYNTQGIMGTRIGSDAFNQYVGNMFSAAKQSWFGLNPSYSYGQATEANNLINQFGYRNPTADRMRNVFSTVAGNVPALSQGQIMQVQDMGFRYGAASLKQMEQQLLAIPTAAVAAQMGVKEFTDQLISTATSIAGEQGIPAATALGQVKSISAGTGFAPGIAGGLLNDQLITNITAARMGGNFFAAQNSPFRGAMALSTTKGFIEQIAGTSWQGLQQMQKNNPRQYQQVLNKLQLVYNSPMGKQVLGNLSPTLINTMIGRGLDPVGMSRAETAITAGLGFAHGPTTGQYSVAAIMTDLHMSRQQQSDFLKNEKGHSYHERLQDLQKTLASEQKKATSNQHRQTVHLALTPGAAKLVKLIGSDNPSTRNQSQTQGENAVHNISPNAPWVQRYTDH